MYEYVLIWCWVPTNQLSCVDYLPLPLFLHTREPNYLLHYGDKSPEVMSRSLIVVWWWHMVSQNLTIISSGNGTWWCHTIMETNYDSLPIKYQEQKWLSIKIFKTKSYKIVICTIPAILFRPQCIETIHAVSLFIFSFIDKIMTKTVSAIVHQPIEFLLIGSVYHDTFNLVLMHNHVITIF